MHLLYCVLHINYYHYYTLLQYRVFTESDVYQPFTYSVIHNNVNTTTRIALK